MTVKDGRHDASVDDAREGTVLWVDGEGSFQTTWNTETTEMEAVGGCRAAPETCAFWGVGVLDRQFFFAVWFDPSFGDGGMERAVAWVDVIALVVEEFPLFGCGGVAFGGEVAEEQGQGG